MGVLDDLANEGERIIKERNTDDARSFVKRGEALLAKDNGKLCSNLNIHRQRISGQPAYTESQQLADVRTIVDAALLAVEEREIRLRELEASAATVNVSAIASAEARMKVKATIRAVASYEGLDEQSKKNLELLLRRMEDSAQDGDEHGFKENAKDALDLADKAAGLVPKIAAAIGGAASMFG